MSQETQTYYAKSAWSDPQNIASAISLLVGVLALPEVVAIVPVTWMPAILAISAALSLLLRTFFGLRPVANIPPGEVKPVEVRKLKKTTPKEKPKE